VRIRTIKPEFFTHEALYDLEASCGLPVRLAFIGLWCAADREGRFKWEPRRLGVQILPYDSADFSRVLDALTTRGFVVKYTVAGVDYGSIPSFARHQVINNREKESELPNPNEINGFDASPTRDPRVTHASKAEGKGREGNEYIDISARESRPSRKPKDLSEVLTNGQFIGMTEDDCRSWFRDMESADWSKTDGTPFGNWKREQVWARDRLKETAFKRPNGKQRTEPDYSKGF